MLEVRTREQLLHLLTEAAEIEHDLLCCYLYAAFSLKRGEDEGLSAREADAVARWRRTVITVAIEEMAHLALVANMTVAIGARHRRRGRADARVERRVRARRRRG